MKNPILIIITVLILAAAFLVFTNTPVVLKAYTKVKVVAGEAAGPALSALSKPGQLVKHVYHSYVNVVGAQKENDQLRKRLEKLEIDNQKIAELERENRRLKTILKLMEQNPNTMIAARVVGEDLRNWFRCIMVDKGRDHGVQPKMPVITPRGIVGQAVEVNKWHTKVMIINDTNSSVDVYVDGKNTRGVLEGTGQSTLKLKYVVKNEDIEIGDKLVTSGKDGIFPKGLPTGIVITVNRTKAGIFSDIDVMPFNNFRRLEEVLIVKR